MELDLKKYIRRATDTSSHKAEDILKGLQNDGFGQISVTALMATSGASERLIKGMIRRSEGSLTIDDQGVLHLSGNRITIGRRGGLPSEHGSGFRGAKRPYRGK